MTEVVGWLSTQSPTGSPEEWDREEVEGRLDITNALCVLKASR